MRQLTNCLPGGLSNHGGQSQAIRRGHSGRWWFSVSGQWAWGSGVQHADYVIVPVLKDDKTGAITAVVPRAEVRIIDNWHALGINGSGSTDYALDNVFVPGHFVSTSPAQRRGAQFFAWAMPLPPTSTQDSPMLWRSRPLVRSLNLLKQKNAVMAPVSVLQIGKFFSEPLPKSELRLRASKLLMIDVLERLFDASVNGEAPIELQAEARAA